MIVLMIDNMAGFKEYFPEQAEEINSLSRESQGVGIAIIITAATSNALNYRTQANFSRKYVLNCNDSGEYSAILGHCRNTPSENQGRGLFVLDRRILEWQAAMFGKSSKEAERSQELREYIKNRNSEAECGTFAVRIPMVPDHMVLDECMQLDKSEFRREGIVPLGMDFEAIAYSSLNLMSTGSLTLLGDMESQMRFVGNLLKTLSKTVVFHNIEAIVIDDKQKHLEAARDYGFVKNYTNSAAEAAGYLADFYDAAAEREDDMNASYIMLVLNNPEMFRQLCADKTASKEFAGIIKKANDAKVFIVIGQVENQAVSFSASDVLKTLKEERKGILFAAVTENKFYETGRMKRDNLFDNSMGYRFDNSVCSKIKLFE